MFGKTKQKWKLINCFHLKICRAISFLSLGDVIEMALYTIVRLDHVLLQFFPNMFILKLFHEMKEDFKRHISLLYKKIKLYLKKCREVVLCNILYNIFNRRKELDRSFFIKRGKFLYLRRVCSLNYLFIVLLQNN